MKYIFKLFGGLGVTFGVMLLIMWLGYGVSKLFTSFSPAECTIIILLTVLCSIGGTMLLGREGVQK